MVVGGGVWVVGGRVLAVTIELFKEIFPNQFISRYGDVPWAPQSPDLTPLDFFLRGY